MLSDNKMDSDKSSGVPISLQMSTLYLPCDDAYAVATNLKVFSVENEFHFFVVQGIKFNHRKPSPDVTQDDLFSSFSQNQPPEIGFK